MSLFADHPYVAECRAAVATVRLAAEVIQVYYEQQSAAVYDKSDGSPVTDADLASDRLIREQLAVQFPHDGILTEEVADDRSRLASDRCWIADPIDGTLQFIARTGRFDVLLALVAHGRPVVAAIANPPSGTILAAALGQGTWLERDGRWTAVSVPVTPEHRPARVVGSIWFGMPDLRPELERISAALGGVAGATLPYGVRPIEFLAPDRPYDALLGPVANPETTYGGEWDFAAADLVLREAGAVMSDFSGQPFRYNKPAIRNPGGLAIASDPALHARIVAATRGN